MNRRSGSRLRWLDAAEWRAACKANDTVLTVFVVDPFVRFFLPVLLALGVTPNQITLSRFGVALAGAWMAANGGTLGAAICFGLWYLLDCMDGKIARLTGKVSVFGDWLDRVTDRVGVSAILFAMGAGFLVSGRDTAGLLAFALMGVWLIRVMNGDRLSHIMRAGLLQSRPGPSSIRPGLEEGLPSFARWSRRWRLDSWVVHDIEWLTIAIVVAPLCRQPESGLVISIVGMLVQSMLHASVFWYRRWHMVTQVSSS